MIPRFRYRLPFKNICKACVQCIQGRDPNERFKNALISFMNVKDGWLTFNGRGALWLALKALNKPGSEVIVPAYACPTVARTVVAAGYKVCSVDSDYGTLSIDKQSLIESISEDTSAVVVVHIAGNPVDIDDIRDVCRQKGIVLIEDCAQSFGAKVKGAHVGMEADMAMYSFGLGKELNTGGGFLIAKEQWREAINKEYRTFVRPPLWKGWGRIFRAIFFKVVSSPFLYRFLVPFVNVQVDQSKEWSGNYSFINDRFSSVLGIMQLKAFPENLKRRNSHVQQWREALRGTSQIVWPVIEKDREPTFLRMVFFMKDGLGDRFVNYLSENGIDGISKREPLTEEFLKPGTFRTDGAANAKKINDSLFALPSDECLKEGEIFRMSRTVKEFFIEGTAK